MHSSIAMDFPCEFIDIIPFNPLISQCKIKVCYVGDEPNRNRSIITKESAKKLANSLPGSPIVGFFNEETNDFDEHTKELEIKDGKIYLSEKTRPYGFVDMNAKCWFQKFLDDGVNEHEYLMTTGYIWTGQYPEAQRIIDKGNNQSMELDEKTLNATWTKDNNENGKFFIINEGLISKLCILGENIEPCFEGSTITKLEFSLEDNFKTQLFSMIQELKDILKEGGTQVFTTYSVKVGDSLWNNLYSISKDKYSIEGVFIENEQKFAVLKDSENKYFRLDFSFDDKEVFEADMEKLVDISDSYKPAETPQFSQEEIEEFKEKKDKEDKSNIDETEDEIEDEDEDKKKKEEEKKEYAQLETEYSSLLSDYSNLLSNYKSLESENTQMKEELNSLKEFKAKIEKKEKQAMIDSFIMLSDEDKADVVKNIDTYSLDDIEAKLSIICVRNKVNFNLDEDNRDTQITSYNLNQVTDSNVPAWVSAALAVEKELKQ